MPPLPEERCEELVRGWVCFDEARKHEQSQSHKGAVGANRAEVRPDRAPMEVALQSMEREELTQMKRLFNTAFYLVSAERPFRDFF